MIRLRVHLYSLLKLYWRIFKPVTLGSRTIVTRGDEVLLVRLSYAQGWYLPGGGIARRESFKDGAIRELREECGLEATKIDLFGLYFTTKQHKVDHVAVFVVSEFKELQQPAMDPEIEAMGFFPMAALPQDTTPASRRRIEEFLAGRRPSVEW